MGIQDLTVIKRVYFLGVGGIGMSALARCFLGRGLEVAGYDRSRTELTDTLEKEGIAICYEEDERLIPPEFKAPSKETLIVYTPAIDRDSLLFSFFERNGHALHKRAAVLGALSRDYTTYAIAGTHGKTTTSTMLAYVLANTLGCEAFLGGVSSNFSTNWVHSERGNRIMVVEADEYDRSFLNLTPEVPLITSIAPDHLDYFGSFANMVDAFREFAILAKRRTVLCHYQVEEYLRGLGLDLITYGVDLPADYQATQIVYDGNGCSYELRTPKGVVAEVKLGISGRHNVENSLAVVALAQLAGLSIPEILPWLASFEGVARRFSVLYSDDKLTFVDDYAHHPDEIRATIAAAREMYPGKHLTGVFQPHLYTRTRDLAYDFARALSGLDSLLLLPIYPAREEPIPGVNSEMLFRLLPATLTKFMATEETLYQMLRVLPIDVLITMGAGNISRIAANITIELSNRTKKGGR